MKGEQLTHNLRTVLLVVGLISLIGFVGPISLVGSEHHEAQQNLFRVF